MVWQGLPIFIGIGLFFPASLTLLTFASNRALGPVITSLIRGIAPPVVKLGLTVWPSALWGCLIGYLTSSLVLLLVQRIRNWRGAARAVAIALAIAAIRVIDPDAHEWFFPMVYGDNPYEHGLLMGVLQKLTALGIGALFSVSLIRLAPEHRGALTTLGRRTLQVYEHGLLMGVLQKLTALGIGALFSVSLIRLAPEHRGALTTLGRRTLQVYVLHRLIRAWLTFHTPLYDLPWMAEAVPGALAVTAVDLPWMAEAVPGALAVTAVTAAVTLVCAAPVFERPFARALKFRWTRAFVRPMRAGRYRASRVHGK